MADKYNNPDNKEVQNLQKVADMQKDPWIDYLGSPLGQYNQYMERQEKRPAAERRPDIEQNINTQFWGNFKAEQGPSVGYWNDPRRIARYYNAIRFAPPGVELPPYLDRDGIEGVYKYLEQTRQGHWLNWEPISEDDPVNIVLRDMPVPPPEAMPNWETDRLAKTHEAEVNRGYKPQEGLLDAGMTDGMSQEEWDALPDYKKFWNRAMPVVSVGLPAAGGAIIGGLAGGPIGAVVGAGGMYGLSAYAAKDPDSFIAKVFRMLNIPAEEVEKALGLGSQAIHSIVDPEQYGDLMEIFGSMENLTAAYQAGRLFYESFGSGRQIIDGRDPRQEMAEFEGSLNEYMSTWIDAPGEVDDTRQIVGVNLSGEDIRMDVPDNKLAQGYVLQEARQRIQNGEAPYDVYLSLGQNFGFFGEMKELVGNVVLDPLDLIGPIANKSISGVGKITDNTRLIEAFSTSGDLLTNTRRFKQLNQMLPVEDAAQLTRFSQWISGLDAQGQVKNLTVKTNPNLFNNLFGLTPKAKASGALKNYVNGLNNLLSLENDPAVIMQMIEGVARMSPENAVNATTGTMRLNIGGESVSVDLPGYFKSTEAQSIPLAIRDAVPTIKELADQWQITRPHAAIIERIAGYMKTTPEKLIADLHHAKKGEANHIFSQFMLRLGDAAKAGDTEAAKLVDLFAKENDLMTLNGEKLKTMADAFFGENGAPYNEAVFKLKTMQALAGSVDNWAANWFGVKPSNAFVRINDVVKRAQGALLLGFNPSYMVNNALNNVMTLAWDGLLKYNGVFGRSKFLKEFGWTPAAYRQGLGAAEIGGLDIANIEVMGMKGKKQIGEGIRGAGRADDTIQKVDDFVRKGDKVQVMASLSQEIEQWSSQVAMASALKEFYDRAWQPGKGFDHVPDELRMMLDAVEPGIADRVEKAIARGLNKAQIEKEIFGNLNRKSVRDVLKPNELELFEKFPGLLDGIESGLKNAKTPDEVRKVFTDMKAKTQERVRENTIRKIEVITNDAMIKAKTEKTQGALDIMDQLIASRNDFHLKHFEFMAQVAEDAAKTKGWERQLLWMDATQKADMDWRTRNDIDAAKYLGVFRGLGADQASPQYMQVLDNFYKLNDNFQTFYDARRVKMNEFFDLPDDMLPADRTAEWHRISEEINQSYLEMVTGEDAVQRGLDKLFVDQYAAQFPDLPRARLEAQNWRSSILKVRRQMQQAMMLYRSGALPDTMKAWGELPKEIHDKITALNKGRGIHTFSRAARDKLNPKFYEVYTGFIRDMTTASNTNAPGKVSPQTITDVELPNMPEPAPKPPVTKKHETDIWQILSEKKPEMAGVDEMGMPVPDAKLDVIKYVLKWSPEARGGKVRTFVDITPEMLESAIAAEKMMIARQPELGKTPDVEPAKVVEEPAQPKVEETPTAEAREGIEKPFEDVTDLTPDSTGDVTPDLEGNPFAGQGLDDLDSYTRGQVEVSLNQFISDVGSSRVIVNPDRTRTWEGGDLWYRKFYESKKDTGDKNYLAALNKRTRSAIEHLQNGTRSKSEVINSIMDEILFDAYQYAKDNDPVLAYLDGDIDLSVKLLDSIGFKDEQSWIAQLGEDAYDEILQRWIKTLEAEDMLQIGDDFAVPGGEIETAPRMTDAQAEQLARRRVIETARDIESNMDTEIRNLPPVKIGREAVERMIFDSLGEDFARAEAVTTLFELFAEQWAKQEPGRLVDDWYETFIATRGGESIDDANKLFQVAPAVDTPEFKTWFRDSAIKTEDKPKLMYHGTGSDFTEFGKIRENDIAGYYFTDNPKDATMYARATGGQANVMPVYLSVQNPADATILRNLTKELGLNRYKDGAKITAELKARGYDGIVLPTETIVFNPEQVKSVFNNGKFDPASRNVLNQDAGKAVNQSMIDAAIDHFGITYDIREAGYVLPDGDLLDLSGKRDVPSTYEKIGNTYKPKSKKGDFLKGSRNSDHRDINVILDTIGDSYKGITDGMMQFMYETNAIRIDHQAGLIDISGPISRQQMQVLKQYFDENGWIDISNPKTGAVIKHIEPNSHKEFLTALKEADQYFRTLNQDQPSNPKGFTRWMEDGTAILHAFESADVSTLVHEVIHVFTPQMGADDAKIVSRWLNKEYGMQLADNWYTDPVGNRQASEILARGFERYLAEGRAPTRKLKKVFENMKTWMLEIYKKISGSDIDIKLNDEITALFDEWMGAEKVAEAEAPKQPKTDQIPDKVTTEIQPIPKQVENAWNEIAKSGYVPGKEYRIEIQNTGGYKSYVYVYKKQNGKYLYFKRVQNQRIVMPDGTPTDSRKTLVLSEKRFSLDFETVQDSDTFNLPDAEIKKWEYEHPIYPEQEEFFANKLKSLQSKTPPAKPEPTPSLWGKPKTRQQGFFESGEDTPLFSGTAQKAQGETFNPQETAPQDSLFDMRDQLPTIEGKKVEGGAEGTPLFKAETPVIDGENVKYREYSGIIQKTSSGYRVLFYPEWKGGGQNTPWRIGKGAKQQAAQDFANLIDANSPKSDMPDGGLFQTAPKTDTPEFKNWFGESKVVDENGQPFTVYHGTGYEFDAFEPQKFKVGFHKTENTYFFTSDSNIAGGYADNTPRGWGDGKGYGQNILPVYLSIKKPYLIDGFDSVSGTNRSLGMYLSDQTIKSVIEDGYDGIIAKNVLDSPNAELSNAHDVYVVFDPTQVKSVNNQGTFDPNDPRMLYQDAPNEAIGAPLGTSEQILEPPLDETMFEGWTNEMSPMLDDAMNRLINSKAPDTSSLAGKLDDNGMKSLRKYLGDTYTKMADTKYGANKYAEGKRNFSLLDYSSRTGLDTVLQMAYPYQFWMTRSMVHWASRIMANPAILSRYMRITNFGRSAEEKEGFPQRLKGKVQIPLPFLPDWMGDSVYIDPFRHVFPFEAVARPFTQLAEQNNMINRKTYSLIQEWTASEQITEEEARTALETMSGELWDKAKTEARASSELEINNPLDFSFAISSPNILLNYLINFSPLGSKDRIGQLPITRTIQAVTAAAGIGGPRGLNIEGPLRKGLGLPEVDKFEDYRIDRELSNMVADGLVDSDTAVKAMIDRKGEAFTEAQRRVSAQALPKSLGSAISLDFFPEGEQEQRQLQQEYGKAIEAWLDGDKQALTTFWDTYPEYEARKTSMINEPEEKLRMFLRSRIWNAWADLNPQEKRKAAAGFGDVFEDAFLNSETRSYDNISTDTYAMWAASLGTEMPEAVAGAPKLDVSLPDGVSKQIDTFNAERDNLFPDIGELLDQYYDLDENSREIFAQSYPQVDEYYAWRTKYIADHPQTAPYLTTESSNLYGLPENVQAAVYRYRADVEQNFPNIYETQTRYFAIEDSKQKKAFLQANPRLTAYWDYKRQFAAANPQAAPYVMSDESLARSILGQDYVDTTDVSYYPDVQQLDPEVLRLLATYFYSGKQLSSGARMELNSLWKELGKPAGSLENWLNGYVRPALKQ